MTTRYAKVNFPLQLSSTSSHSDQLLPQDIPETEESFETTNSIIRLGLDITEDAPTAFFSWDLRAWDTVHRVYVYNHTDSATSIAAEWVPLGSEDSVYMLIGPGESAMITGVDPTGNVFSAGAAVNFSIEQNGGTATCDVIILGE